MATMHQEQAATMMTGSEATGSSDYATGQHEAGSSLVSKIILIPVVIIALTTGGYFAYEVFVNDKSPSQVVSFLHSKGQEVIGLFLGKEGETPAPPAGGQEVVTAPPAPVAPAPVAPAPVAPAPEALAPEMATVPVPAVPAPEPEAPTITEYPPEGVEMKPLPNLPNNGMDNPYLELPNSPPDSKMQFARAWSMQEEDVWRSGITHQFAWQQHKTVQDVITLRLAGSDAILWEALNNPRLWTRMRALTGLVRFGLNVDSNTVLRAIGDARPSLVANYFKRFTVRSTPSQRFIMRYALRTVKPRARLHIVMALVVGDDKTSDLYLVAATRDPDPLVSKWAEAELKRKNMPPEMLEKYRSEAGIPAL